MSSVRSRSGGMCIGMTLSLKKRSSRSLPSAMRSLGFRLVAAMTRVSKETASDAPSGSNVARDQGPDELGLGPEVHLADLVQEERPAVGEEELALLVLEGVGGVALDRSEQLVSR